MSGIAKSNSFPDLFFLHQIAALIVGIAVVIDAGELLLIAAHMLAHHLVEVVVLVGIPFTLGRTALLEQIAQRIVGVAISEGIVGIDLQLAGAADEPVQRVIGVEGLVLGLADAVAPHILIGYVAVGIIRISMLLGLGGLFAGMGVLDLQDAAHLVVGIILHPAVGIPHLRDTAHAVVGVLHPLAGVVRGSGQLMQEIQFEGSRA